MMIAAGTILVIETGEYSSYTFHGPFRVVRDFDQAEAVAAHRAQHRPTEDDVYDHPTPETFLGWLNKEGMIEPIDGVVSWHVGSYGELDPEIG